MLTRLLTALLALASGAGIGLVLTFTHRQFGVEPFGVPVPLGLIGALAVVGALVFGIRLGFEDRVATLAAGAGVVAMSIVLAFPIGAGTVLLLDDLIGYAWAVGPAVLTLAAVFLPFPPAVRPR